MVNIRNHPNVIRWGTCNRSPPRYFAVQPVEHLRPITPLQFSFSTSCLSHCCCHCPAPCSFLGVCFDPPIIVMDLCTGGSLADVLAKAREGRDGMAHKLTWECRINMVSWESQLWGAEKLAAPRSSLGRGAQADRRC